MEEHTGGVFPCPSWEREVQDVCPAGLDVTAAARLMKPCERSLTSAPVSGGLGWCDATSGCSWPGFLSSPHGPQSHIPGPYWTPGLRPLRPLACALDAGLGMSF